MGRDDELRDAMLALNPNSEFQGVALVGESGVGKSTLARKLGARLTADGDTVRFVLGTQTGRDVPLGAFSRSVTVAAACEPAVMLAIAHQSLAAAENLVIVVDDAQLLDPLSATLVYQLAAESTARLIVVIRSGESIFDAITALLKEHLLLNLHIGPFSREQTGELARRALGGVVSPQVIKGLHDRSAGSPLYLRGLLRAGKDSGVLTQDDDVWHLRGPLHADRELADLLDFRLQDLTPDELEALEVLATAEILDWEVFRELCSPEAVSGLERHRLIHLAFDGAGTLAQVTHPVFREAVLERAGVARSRQLNGMLAKAFDKYLRGGGHRLRLPDMRGRIRMAQFMIGSDLEPDLDLIIDAAISAAAVSNPAHAEDLARFAFDRDGGLLAALVLGYALCGQGRGDEAEAVLSRVSLDDADEQSIIQWGCLRASNLFWNCGEIDAARRILAEARDRAHDEESAALPEALNLTISFFSDDLTTTLRAGPPFCAAAASPVATALAALPTAQALIKVGRFGDATRIAEAGLHALRGAARSPSGALLFGLGLAEVMALVAAGDIPAAELAVERFATMAAGVPEPHAMAVVLSGFVHLVRGELALACSAFQNSMPELSGSAPPLWPMLANAWATQAEAARGNTVAATAALQHCEAAYGPADRRLSTGTRAGPGLGASRAWSDIRRSGPRAAGSADRAAIRDACR